MAKVRSCRQLGGSPLSQAFPLLQARPVTRWVQPRSGPSFRVVEVMGLEPRQVPAPYKISPTRPSPEFQAARDGRSGAGSPTRTRGDSIKGRKGPQINPKKPEINDATALAGFDLVLPPLDQKRSRCRTHLRAGIFPPPRLASSRLARDEATRRVRRFIADATRFPQIAFLLSEDPVMPWPVRLEKCVLPKVTKPYNGSLSVKSLLPLSFLLLFSFQF